MSIAGAVVATAAVFLMLSLIFAVAAAEAYDHNRRPLLVLASVSLALAAPGFIAAAWLDALS